MLKKLQKMECFEKMLADWKEMLAAITSLGI